MAPNPSEVPMVEKCIKNQRIIEKRQKLIECQIKAIVAFIDKCKSEAEELARDLASCEYQDSKRGDA